MQSANKVLMVRPAAFGFNPQTAESNKFQKQVGGLKPEQIQAKAAAEFDNLVEVLIENGVEVFAENDTPQPLKPDAIFPNNWVGFHHGKRVFLYPMLAENRRLERREDIIRNLELVYGYVPNELTDFTYLEKEGMYLEGTGSVVFDHDNQTAYCGISPRSNAKAFQLLCTSLRYQGVEFDIYDGAGFPIYHTNVMLSIGSDWIVVCFDAIPDKAQRGNLLQSLIWTGKDIIKISLEQMEKFCGNVLQLTNKEGDKLILMSDTAYKAFTTSQMQALKSIGTKIIHVPIPTIEEHGGGSIRCMIAEMFD
jgi:hypothetical protein